MTVTIVMTFELIFYVLPTEAYESRPSRFFFYFHQSHKQNVPEK
jgi:hypothetical protein